MSQVWWHAPVAPAQEVEAAVNQDRATAHQPGDRGCSERECTTELQPGQQTGQDSISEKNKNKEKKKKRTSSGK